MRYRTQSIAYWYFALALCLFGLQMVFGMMSVVKYLGPDPLLDIIPFDRFWRNVRTHTLHDPIDYKLNTLGRWALKGEAPDPQNYS